MGFVVRPPSPPAPLAWHTAVPPGLCAGRHPLCSLPPFPPSLPQRGSPPAARRRPLPHPNPPCLGPASASRALGAGVSAGAVCGVPGAGGCSWWLLCGWHPPPPLGGMHALEGARRAAGVLPAPGPPAASRVCICVRHGECWWVPGGWGGGAPCWHAPPPHMPTWDGVGRGGGWWFGATRPGRRCRPHTPASAQHPIRTVLSVRCVTHPQPQGGGSGGRAAATLVVAPTPTTAPGLHTPPHRTIGAVVAKHAPPLQQVLVRVQMFVLSPAIGAPHTPATGVGPGGGGVLRCMGAQRGPVLPSPSFPVGAGLARQRQPCCLVRWSGT